MLSYAAIHSLFRNQKLLLTCRPGETAASLKAAEKIYSVSVYYHTSGHSVMGKRLPDMIYCSRESYSFQDAAGGDRERSTGRLKF